jgi:hypothetical protein
LGIASALHSLLVNKVSATEIIGIIVFVEVAMAISLSDPNFSHQGSVSPLDLRRRQCSIGNHCADALSNASLSGLSQQGAIRFGQFMCVDDAIGSEFSGKGFSHGAPRL